MFKKTSKKRLVLNKETLRNLTVDELRHVAGGNAPQPPTNAQQCGQTYAADGCPPPKKHVPV